MTTNKITESAIEKFAIEHRKASGTLVCKLTGKGRYSDILNYST